MNTEQTTPKEWPSGQAGWYRLANRCEQVTRTTPEGYAATWCGAPTEGEVSFCYWHTNGVPDLTPWGQEQ